MKKFLFIISLNLMMGMTSVTGGNLWAYLSYATFNSPDGPYIETYLSVDAKSVIYERLPDGSFQGTVFILMTFKQNNEIKAFKKYELKSPKVADTTRRDFHFIDQQRFLLPNGSYEFEVQLSDQNKKAEITPYTQTVSINYPKEKPAVSGIELVKSYQRTETPGEISKSGFDLVPNVYNFFPQADSRLLFYFELYNIGNQVGEGEKYLLTYFVETLENGQRVKNLAKIKKETAKEITAVLADLNIVNLPTGNYNLVVEARDQQNQVIASKKLFFQRSNPYARLTIDDLATVNPANSFVEKLTNIDTLREYVSSTYPISSALEKNFLKGNLRTADLAVLQQYFLGFWQRRNAEDPQKSWEAYKYLVEVAQHNFGTPVKKGYQTDRGRVFLQYGAPNVRAERYNEPSNYPYEIWQYYSLGNQSNRKFVFYSPDMVTSDFFLLHSDAIGEFNNPRWQVDLRSRVYQTIDITDTQVINSWGDMQEDYWTLPN
ncbi:MAG: GWxTD domain-containing protein [Bacteroidetes bacterium]|nr:MAG: GWxTD domain-containing protein [Bacteroidota bacterium]